MSSLDQSLRVGLRHQLARVLKQTQLATVWVTHDQAEAMGVADRILIMREGRIVQDGKPQEMVAAPADAWVARFLGLGAIVKANVGPDSKVDLGGQAVLTAAPTKAGPADVLLPIQSLHLGHDCAGGRCGVQIPGRVASANFEVMGWLVEVQPARETDPIRVRSSTALTTGDNVLVHVPDGVAIAFPA
jgi:ABC-type Fe3+/spermidine/putrescine transport system ATPase subunit